MAHERAVNDLYELTNSISDRAFVSDDGMRSNDDGVRLIEV